MSAQSKRPPVKRQYGSRKSATTATTFNPPSLPAPSSSSSSIKTSSSSPLRSTTSPNPEWEAAVREENDRGKGKSREIESTPPTSPGLLVPSRVRTRSQSKSPQRRRGKVVEEDQKSKKGGDLRNFFTRTTTANKKRRLSSPGDESDKVITTITTSSSSSSMSRQTSTTSSNSSISSSSLSSKRSKQQQPEKLSQLYLDPFQTPGRSTLSCSICSLSYSRTPEDINFHSKHHKKIVSGIDFAVQEGAKGVTVLDDAVEWGKGGEEGKILMIDWVVAENGLKRKLNEVMETIDTELCSTSLTAEQLSESKLFMFVTNKGRKVVACAVVQRIKHAYRVVTPSSSSSSSSSSSEKKEGLIKFEDDGGDSSAVFCSPEPLATILGVHRIWTSTSFRRNGLASLLLDHVASRFMYGCPIGKERRKEDVAFSQPTGKGKELAKRWTGTVEFKVFVD
ncbi:hypothetical protein JCM3765_005699 [Sporobolomyces pararoseus]